MPLYESTFIARQDISAAEAQKLAELFSGFVTAAGGSIVKNEYWGVKTLTYRIKKNRKGHYTMLGIDASPEAVKEMERNMGIHEDVLRHLTVKVEALDASPSVMMQRGGRDDGYEGGGDDGRPPRRDRDRDRDRGDRGDRGDRDPSGGGEERAA